MYRTAMFVGLLAAFPVSSVVAQVDDPVRDAVSIERIWQRWHADTVALELRQHRYGLRPIHPGFRHSPRKTGDITGATVLGAVVGFLIGGAMVESGAVPGFIGCAEGDLPSFHRCVSPAEFAAVFLSRIVSMLEPQDARVLACIR